MRRRSHDASRLHDEDFNLDDIDGDLGFQPMYGQTDHQATGNIAHAVEPETSSALAKVKNLIPTNMADLTGLGGKAMGAATDVAKDAFSLPSFMSILASINPASFSKPGSVMEASKRLRQNVIIYRRNYIFTGVILFFLTILTSPFLLFPLLIVAGVWVILLSQKEDPDVPPPKFAPISLNKKTKCLILAPITFIFTWWMASASLIWCIVLAALISGIHGVFHSAPAHMKAVAQMQAQNEARDAGRIPMHTNSLPDINQDVDDKWWDMQ